MDVCEFKASLVHHEFQYNQYCIERPCLNRNQKGRKRRGRGGEEKEGRKADRQAGRKERKKEGLGKKTFCYGRASGIDELVLEGRRLHRAKENGNGECSEVRGSGKGPK